MKPVINPEEEIRKNRRFLRRICVSHLEWVCPLGLAADKIQRFAGKLAQMAIDELNEEQDKVYRFYAVRLPYGVQADEQIPRIAIAFMKATDVLRGERKGAVDASESAVFGNTAGIFGLQ